MASLKKPTVDGLLQQQLHELLGRLRPRNLLLISSCPDDLSDVLQTTPFTLCIEVSGGTARGSVVCRTHSLPFADDTFDVLVIHQLLRDGLEPELGEAQRLIRPGGQILVIGTGRFAGTKNRLQAGIPALDVKSVVRDLQKKDFLIRQCDGIGLRGRPILLSSAWQKPALRFSDWIMIRGRRQDNRPMVTPLRFRQASGTSVRMPALDGLSREAVQ